MILGVEDEHAGHADDLEAGLLGHLGEPLRLDLQAPIHSQSGIRPAKQSSECNVLLTWLSKT